MATANIVYGKLSSTNDPMYGKYEAPIMALIEDESNASQVEDELLKFLFNVERSKRYSETIMGESDFGLFQKAGEGQGAELDSVEKTFEKTIGHQQFMKEFVITREMADDAKMGITTQMKQRPRKFVRAYKKTRARTALGALCNATKDVVYCKDAGCSINVTTGDKKPLFSGEHTYALPKFKGKKQSNYFYGDVCRKGTDRAFDIDLLKKKISALSNKFRNFKDENGEIMSYVPDTIIIPCNRPELEDGMKVVLGTEKDPGSNLNGINIQYGNWNLVVMPNWETDDDRFIMMSKDCSEENFGNMFFNRIDLDIINEIDRKTRNLVWNGYCRFGVGFATWKHVLMAVDSKDAVTNATKLA